MHFFNVLKKNSAATALPRTSLGVGDKFQAFFYIILLIIETTFKVMIGKHSSMINDHFIVFEFRRGSRQRTKHSLSPSSISGTSWTLNQMRHESNSSAKCGTKMLRMSINDISIIHTETYFQSIPQRMYCVKGTRKSTLLLVCHNICWVLKYFVGYPAAECSVNGYLKILTQNSIRH